MECCAKRLHARFFVSAALIALMLAATPAFAENVNPIDISPWSLVKQVFDAKDPGSLVSAINDKKDLFIPTAKNLSALLIVIMVGFGALRRMMGTGLDDVITDLVRGVIVFSIPFAAINNWELIGNIFFDGLRGLSDGFVKDPILIASELVDKTVKSLKTEQLEWYNVLTHLPNILIWILAVFLVTAAVVYLLFHLFLSFYLPQVYMAIGMVVGPLLVIWMPFRALSGLAARWIDFMIANAVTLIVAGLIITGASTAIDKLLESANKVVNGSVFDVAATPFLTVLLLVFLLLVVATLLGQANNIAQGLTGGAAIGGGLMERIGGKMVAAGSASTAKTAMTNTLKAPGAIAGLTAKGAKAVYNASPELGTRLSGALQRWAGMSKEKADDIGTKAMSISGKLSSGIADKAEKAAKLSDKMKDSAIRMGDNFAKGRSLDANNNDKPGR